MGEKTIQAGMVAVCGALASSVAQAGESLPHVVLIMADDFGVGSINAYGAPEELVRTPALNRLAEEGIRFTNAYVPSSVCSPTRYGLLTGRYPWRGPLPFAVVNVNDPLVIETDRPTLGRLMKESGYQTAMIGKWHLGYGSERRRDPAEILDHLVPGPNQLGFDYHFGLPQNLDDLLRVWIENETIYGLRSRKTSPYARSYYGAEYVGFDAPQRSREEAMEFLTRKASEWIKRCHRNHPDKPFFLYFAPPAVHHPILASETMRGASDCGVYGDFIQDLDLSLGRLMETLAYEGILDRTLIVFTSDNGADIPGGSSSPEMRARQAGLQANGLLRGDKHTIFEGGLRVPLLVRWPGRVEPGTVSDHLISLVDVYATFAEAFSGRGLAGGEAPDSFSFLPALLGEAQRPRDALIGSNAAGILGMREGPWKYIEGEFPDALPENHPMRKWPELSVQTESALYDLANDPGEQQNLVDQHPEVVQRMRRTLDQYRRQGGSR